ncbi:adenylate cyclase [Nostoc commune NIES-4072]|uniref:Adenylate cyclase n=1 Tax=Nostoc commune NIES-4072 TaxID=2005467 RepID=A0A2R5FTZ4_NOSCO|nr:CHASE2 domain-containing protein [Nostoc commune]BBD69322.1 adenylate cyclase [Nostoc commune HK-02]GBG19683.1 adenylate cyclase [Nostoc commune NIES-4072]
MGKLVVLKLDGDLELGVRVTLEIGEDGKRPSIETSGHLPANLEIAKVIDEWRSTYCSLGSARLKAKKIIYDGSISQRRDECQNKACELRSHLNHWLKSESFWRIREKWLKHLMPNEEVRVLIRTASMQLEKIPWHLWDLLDLDYTKAEVALSLPELEQVTRLQTSTYRHKINILAVLGDKTDINVDEDCELLKKLPNATTTFLTQPQRDRINDQLWNQPWNILFFAGHSKSEGETGRIYINDKDSLTIADLKYALRNAVTNGLQLAIFNSCDGLGLARELQDLHIPQIIVMREPVPDLVAQAFLKHFLAAFSSGVSLYIAVRTAREKLQGLEDKFPGASWLPIICENPVAIPMTWPKPLIKSNSSLLIRGLLMSVMLTISVLGVRQMGRLQTWELQAYDQLMRSRPQEKQDPRLLIITVTEEDFQLPEQKERRGSLSELALTRLLEKLAHLEPKAIGLDIYHDQPSQRNQASLATRLKTDDKLFAICKVQELTKERPGISAPLGVTVERQGFSDIIPDSDHVLRRHLLAMQPADVTSPCTARYALNAQLAFHYLEAKGISAKYTDSGDLQLGKVIFKRLQPQMGGYQQADTRGYQMLLNYRSVQGSPGEIAPKVTLTDVLKGKVNPEQVKDRIVLIGTTAQSFRDYSPTPYMTGQGFSEEIPGVVLQAQMVSQLVSAVMDGRPLISVLPVWGEVLWVWSWSVVGGAFAAAGSVAIAASDRSRLYLVLAAGGVLGVLYAFCLILFYQGIWVPLVPSALVLVATGGTVAIYLFSQQSNDN